MLKRILIGAVIGASAFFNAEAQKLTAHNGTVPNSYNFWLYTPENTLEEEVEPKPVVIFLHGASLCGRDLNKVRRYGTLDAIEKGRNILKKK